MRYAWLLALVVVTMPALAQNPGRDGGRPQRRMMQERGFPADSQGREELMRQVTERFMANYRQQAGLTPEQDQKFRAVAQRSFEQRRARQQREQALWRGLELQMRPGVAANADSVTRLLDGIVAIRSAAVDQARADQKEFATFLTPVQRAQLFLQYERLQRSIEDVVQRRMQGGADRRGPPPQ